MVINEAMKLSPTEYLRTLSREGAFTEKQLLAVARIFNLDENAQRLVSMEVSGQLSLIGATIESRAKLVRTLRGSVQTVRGV